MPLKNETRVCINHSDQPLVRIEGHHILTKLDVTEKALSTTKGFPVIAYLCPRCGYVELAVPEELLGRLPG